MKLHGHKVSVSREPERGCGYRSPGGFYLRGGLVSVACGKLPAPLPPCECCGREWRVSRQWVKIWPHIIFDSENFNERMTIGETVCPKCNGQQTVGPDICSYCLGAGKDLSEPLCRGNDMCETCPLRKPPEDPAGMLWVGAKHYTPQTFIAEANRMGVSKRVPKNKDGSPKIPDYVKVGESWVFLAHAKVPTERPKFGKEPEVAPALFHAFQLTAVEFIVTGDESKEYLDKLVAQGVDLVHVIQVEEGQEDFLVSRTE